MAPAHFGRHCLAMFEPKSAPPVLKAVAPAVSFGPPTCRECGNPVGKLGGPGFCRMCGAPLCAHCASKNLVPFEGRRTLVIPLFFIPLSLRWTRSIYPRVSVCRTCLSGIFRRKQLVLPKSIAGCLIVALGLALPFIVAYGPDAVPGATIIAVLFGILSFIPIFLALKYLDEKSTHPTCPVCGRDAMGLLFRTSSKYRVRSGPFPDFIKCRCGYEGVRSPMDGLWLFVDRHGPAPLAGTSLEAMARASAFARHGRN